MSRWMLHIFIVSLGLMATPVFSSGQEAVSVQQAWVKLAPPGAAVNAAYMRLQNQSPTAQVIVAVSADCCTQVMMHESRLEGDRVVMDHKERLEIPAQSELVLAPGGLHLMLMGAQAPLAMDDKVSFVFEFADGTQKIIIAPVKRAAHE
jgi:copper(I)-binding protein